MMTNRTTPKIQMQNPALSLKNVPMFAGNIKKTKNKSVIWTNIDIIFTSHKHFKLVLMA
jgi:hypothetical protein